MDNNCHEGDFEVGFCLIKINLSTLRYGLLLRLNNRVRKQGKRERKKKNLSRSNREAKQKGNVEKLQKNLLKFQRKKKTKKSVSRPSR